MLSTLKFPNGLQLKKLLQVFNFEMRQGILGVIFLLIGLTAYLGHS